MNAPLGSSPPPMGRGRYVMCGVSGVRFEDLGLACMPLLVALLGALLLVTYWPGLSLWLPTLVMGP